MQTLHLVPAAGTGADTGQTEALPHLRSKGAEEAGKPDSSMGGLNLCKIAFTTPSYLHSLLMDYCLTDRQPNTYSEYKRLERNLVESSCKVTLPRAVPGLRVMPGSASHSNSVRIVPYN